MEDTSVSVFYLNSFSLSGKSTTLALVNEARIFYKELKLYARSPQNRDTLVTLVKET